MSVKIGLYDPENTEKKTEVVSQYVIFSWGAFRRGPLPKKYNCAPPPIEIPGFAPGHVMSLTNILTFPMVYFKTHPDGKMNCCSAHD